MPSFSARLHLPGRTRLPLTVEVDVSDERMRLTAGERLVADWPLAEAEVSVQPDGFHITVDSEEMVLNIADAASFAAVLGVSAGGPTLGPTNGPAARGGSLSRDSLKEMRYDDVKSRISDIAALITSSSVPPAEVFTRWLRLLKEINRRHGNGSIPIHVFYELNSELLELIPEPSETAGDTATP